MNDKRGYGMNGKNKRIRKEILIDYGPLTATVSILQVIKLLWHAFRGEPADILVMDALPAAALVAGLGLAYLTRVETLLAYFSLSCTSAAACTAMIGIADLIMHEALTEMTFSAAVSTFAIIVALCIVAYPMTNHWGFHRKD